MQKDGAMIYHEMHSGLHFAVLSNAFAPSYDNHKGLYYRAFSPCYDIHNGDEDRQRQVHQEEKA
jgi:hypothetical protein